MKGKMAYNRNIEMTNNVLIIKLLFFFWFVDCYSMFFCFVLTLILLCYHIIFPKKGNKNKSNMKWTLWYLSRRGTLTHFGTVLWGSVWERALGTELRGGGWTSALREGTERSDTEGTSFLSGEKTQRNQSQLYCQSFSLCVQTERAKYRFPQSRIQKQIYIKICMQICPEYTYIYIYTQSKSHVYICTH